MGLANRVTKLHHDRHAPPSCQPHAVVVAVLVVCHDGARGRALGIKQSWEWGLRVEQGGGGQLEIEQGGGGI